MLRVDHCGRRLDLHLPEIVPKWLDYYCPCQQMQRDDARWRTKELMVETNFRIIWGKVQYTVYLHSRYIQTIYTIVKYFIFAINKYQEPNQTTKNKCNHMSSNKFKALYHFGICCKYAPSPCLNKSSMLSTCFCTSSSGLGRKAKFYTSERQIKY